MPNKFSLVVSYLLSQFSLRRSFDVIIVVPSSRKCFWINSRRIGIKQKDRLPSRTWRLMALKLNSSISCCLVLIFLLAECSSSSPFISGDSFRSTEQLQTSQECLLTYELSLISSYSEVYLPEHILVSLCRQYIWISGIWWSDSNPPSDQKA